MDHIVPGFVALGLANRAARDSPSTVGGELIGQTPTELSQDVSEPETYPTMPKRKRDTEGDVSSIQPQIPSDPIIDALHSFIQQERKRDFHFLAEYSHKYKYQKELLVVSKADLTEAKAIHKPSLETWDVWYTFTEPLRSDGFSRTVAIEIPPAANPTVANTTITELGRKGYKTIRPAADWIRNTYSSPNDMWCMQFTDQQYEEQRLWWSNTGQSFRLLDLPSEMREAIYLQILGRIAVPDIVDSQTQPIDKKLVIGFGHSYDKARRIGANRDPDIDHPDLTIMRTSSRVRAEVTTVAHRDTTKRFTALRPREKRMNPKTCPADLFSRAPSLSPDPTFLRHVQLEMTAKLYFLSIRILPRPGKPFASATAGFPTVMPLETLKQFTGLQTLDFRFISPKHEDAKCPWSTTAALHSCQKTWIHWYFLFAWPRLKAVQDFHANLPTPHTLKFTLSGCVKSATRRYWEYTLNDKRVDHTKTIRAMETKLRHRATKMDIKDMVKCACENPCAPMGGKRLFQCSEYEVRRIEGLQEEMDKYYWDFEDEAEE
ncbi:hypothetical protein BDW02DRAFT_571736 [Decorospora gaudefroyi]|uniref:Uncharacterized protein n=1 Tax=Decorospora gaudefroyi TaxID=184978 RepID=A0A6A5K4X2_9PLEO|nr:hypothetical protein BDW02DRAFT_571736 [Decorospora gaudefroyi]